MSLWDELKCWASELDQRPMPDRLECGPRVYHALRRDYYASAESLDIITRPVARMMMMSIVVLPEMPEDAWRVLDVEGNVLEEGTFS